MKKQHSNKHIFAFYLSDLAYYLEGAALQDVITIEEKELSLRVGKILHLKRDDTIIFFNQYKHIVCTIVICSKTIFQVTIIAIHDNKMSLPYVTVLLPILKRDALETAIYNLTEIGIAKIQLIMTQKVQRKWGGQKEYTRLQKIIYAAAEQSKNYAFPDICEPMQLGESVKKNPGETYFFDQNQKPIMQLISDVVKIKPERITLISGPEGGFTEQEKITLLKNNFSGYTLTCTTLRALQTITLAAGIIRSIN